MQAFVGFGRRPPPPPPGVKPLAISHVCQSTCVFTLNFKRLLASESGVGSPLDSLVLAS